VVFHCDQFGPFCAQLTDMDLVLPLNTGAEAVETAIKVARKWGYTVKGIAVGQAVIIVFDGNFHARTTTIVSFSTDSDARADFGPYTPGFRVVPYGDTDAVAAVVAELGERVVAVLVEPIQGEAGVIVPPPGGVFPDMRRGWPPRRSCAGCRPCHQFLQGRQVRVVLDGDQRGRPGSTAPHALSPQTRAGASWGCSPAIRQLFRNLPPRIVSRKWTCQLSFGFHVWPDRGWQDQPAELRRSRTAGMREIETAVVFRPGTGPGRARCRCCSTPAAARTGSRSSRPAAYPTSAVVAQ
jgi:hypothetical protein